MSGASPEVSTGLVMVAKVHTSGGEDRLIKVAGLTASALRALVAAGDSGCIAPDVSPYAISIRDRYGLAISTTPEEYGYGWVCRHKLKSRVEIISTRFESERELAP